ncbi:MAG: EamA family transporter RarD [FCB group bacterium]|nr:EamA family transporter RarD [FCB group bacterium]
MAFLLWGLFPIYWKALRMLPPAEILSHRIIWAFLFFVVILTVRHRWGELALVVREKKSLLTLAVTATLITVNWLVFIWAVNSGQIVEASLGYFINPLVNVLLGVLLLREHLSRWQIISVVLAAIGVSILTIQVDRFPWIALTLALSFGSYGFLRKTARAESLIGLTVETGLLTPFVLFYLLAVADTPGGAALHQGFLTWVLLVGAGVVTGIPLLLFNYGTRMIRYSTVGFLQYLAPTLQLLLGIILYHETFTTVHLISFSFIWLGLILYTISAAEFGKFRR